ncbi:uncharacterized protein LOC143358390 [Halictus rubicundus]|uniref:uncharacterized protein LOC143358390 n=1 Tax=Halictus rubicundus TaxID=77578 RepID=UPI004036779C
MKNEISVDNKECVSQVCISHRREHGYEHEHEYEHGHEHELGPRLEVARSGVIAERMTPAIKIIYEKLDTLANSSVVACCMEKGKEQKKGIKEEEIKNLWNGKRTSVDETTTEMSDLQTCLDKQIGEEDKDDKDEVMSYESVESNVAERIAEIVGVSDAYARSNETRFHAPSRSAVGISTKYNLNNADMTLLYSLTPSVESECPDNANERTLCAPTLASLLAGETNNRRPHHRDRSNEEKQQDRDLEETPNCIWFEDFLEDNEKHERSFGSDRTEVYSYEGSDILELPSSTVLELLETTGDDFRNDISVSANEIIAELDANDTYANILCLVAEIFERVCTLCGARSIDQHGELHVSRSTSTLSPLLSRRLSSSTLLSTVKDRESYHPTEKNVEIRQRSLSIENENENENMAVFVVSEIVHHVIDANDANDADHANDQFERKSENTAARTTEVNRSFKHAKNSTNADIKEAQNTTNTVGIDQIPSIACSVALDRMDNEENESVTVTTGPVVGAKTESVAVFEFHTIARKKLTKDNEREVELNFRVETRRDSRYIVDDGEAARILSGKHETGCSTCSTDETTSVALLAGGSFSGSGSCSDSGSGSGSGLGSGSDSVSYAERGLGFSNSFENESDDKQTESPKLSEFEDLADEETPLKSFEFCDECMYCVKHYCPLDHRREAFLPSINEELESTFAASKNTMG